MAKKKNSNSSSDKQQWQKMFSNVMELLQEVARDREECRDRLVSDANLYKEHISELESEITTLTMIRKVDGLKSDLLVSMKQRDASVYKAKFDSTAGDLKDLKAAFDCVTKETNATQISALKSERDFVWNQYKTMEREYTEKLKSKNNEIKQDNDKIMRLLKDMEQLRSSNLEKDSTIRKLKSDVDELRTASVKTREEIDLLRKARNGSATPSLRGCTVTSHMGKNKGDDNRNTLLKIEANPSGLHEKGTRSSKRKAADSTPISETPRLFTSSFKVPKLKNPSPRVN